ncbi:unnamed protein product [marine sediment metagenome]|uniref:HNH nuclease domain-containing protein n=1 Tax=marine sediment metagenome TaxID=412755 RepID=X0SQ08_9ZZZZ
MADKVYRFIIVPDKVIQSRDLNNGAKLLLGLIMRLSNKNGYCWASNKYFADCFDVNRATVIRWVNELKEYKYIKCSVKKTRRRIYINKKLLENIYYCQVSKTVANLKKSICKMYQYRVWKKKVKERDKEKCRLCGTTVVKQLENGTSSIGLVAHHILPITLLIDYYSITNKEEAKKCKLLWDIDNGITLCDRCHMMKHGVKYWDILFEERGRRNATIDNTTYYKQEQLDSAALANRDDFDIEEKEWTDKNGKKHKRVSIDYGEKPQ